MTDGVYILCLYGPESTGKSTMARHLAEIYHTAFVPEVAREMIVSNDFTTEDIIRIGIAQTARVADALKTANRVLFCDTDLITTQLYAEHYLHEVPTILFDLERKVRYDQYFLFDVDIPWQPDGLRDLGNRRQEMYERFRQELIKRSIDYRAVRGTFAERESIIRRAVDQWLD
jgi:HTH-type transcriptional repressor of NAD biosynthesis genes